MNQGPLIQENRRRLGAELRRRRELKGLSGRALANLVSGISQSTISRIELGQVVPSIPQTQAWADATGASAQEQAELVRLTEQAYNEVDTFRKALTGGDSHFQSHIQSLETVARTLWTFQPTLVIGLLQTADYATRVIRLSDPTGQQDYAAAVAKRMDRQQALYDSDRRFHFILTEAALRWRPGAVRTHLAQLDRIASIATLDNVTIGVVPLNVEATGIGWHGFTIYDDLDDGGQPYVRTELMHAAITISDPADVEIYRTRMEQFRQAAHYDEDAGVLLEQIAMDLRTTS